MAKNGQTAKGRDALIAGLNDDLSREYQAIIAYVIYSQVLKGAEYMAIAKELEVHATQELQHALMNVVLNAVQACAKGGSVSMTLDAGPPARVRVSDTGCGIAAADRQRIFEPFFSLRKGGTGLGLFLALNFLRRSGGDISVTSEPGRGSTFEIVLPAPSPGAEQVA